METSITKRQEQLLSTICQHIKNNGYPPTFEEMKNSLKVASNQSIFDLLNHLEKKKFIKRNEGAARSITILPLGYKILGKKPLAPFLGTSSAGTPLEAVAISGEWQEISPELSQLQDEIFLLKVSGDSMINAGIDDGDVVLIKSQKEFISSDVVLAQIEGESTIKRFISDDKPPFVYLKPENPKYKVIPFTEQTELKGKAIFVFKNSQWKPIK